MAGGKLYLFRLGKGAPPSPSFYFRPPDEIADLDASGAFDVPLPPGKYAFTAIDRKSRGLIGPPLPGERLYPTPVALERGEAVVEIAPGSTTRIGPFEAVPYDPGPLPRPDALTVIEGTVRDPSGRPVAGAIVLAFPTAELLGKPLFASERTGPDGKYRLRVGGAGSFFLKARTSLTGGHPEDGEIIGIHGDGRPTPVTVEAGHTLSGTDIRGFAFVIHSGTKGPSKGGAKP
jgi:hypothetical protein